MLKLENLTKHYKKRKKTVVALDKINLEFHKGEFVSILGISGKSPEEEAGESEALHGMMGLV